MFNPTFLIMKKILLPLSVAVLSLPFNLFAQTGEIIEKCLTHDYYLDMLAKDPSLAQRMEQLEKETERFIEMKEMGLSKMQAAPMIIPVVFHVIHDYGAENIPWEQCADQVRIMNEDFRFINADKSTIPSVFASKGADVNVEFRMATLDPNGKCTNGVVRKQSKLTYDANNAVKAVSYWPSDKYLNIWVVNSIEDNDSDPQTQVLGYAQFPNSGSATTDGVVLRANVIGDIGSGALSGNKGRTGVHEVGHWLNLRHIWGDADCGSDNVSDTPTHKTSNSGCPTFPHDVNVCSGTGANGEMFMNHMDYSSGNCRKMFSAGQASRMQATLSGSRSNLWSAGNLTATGVSNPSSSPCIPVADFSVEKANVCAGTAVKFIDLSWNANPTGWSWTFPGGTPATSTDSIPYVTYNNPGVYNVTLSASTSTGASSPVTKTAVVTVGKSTATHVGSSYKEDFENATTFNNDWSITNSGSVGWVRSSSVGYKSSSCLWVNNMTNTIGDEEALVSSGYDMTAVSGPGSPQLFFKAAYAQKSATNADKLEVYYSIDCGYTWVKRKTISGTALASVGTKTSAFTPASDTEWKDQTASLGGAVNGNNVLLKFLFTSGDSSQKKGNNLYIDDINIMDPLGVDEKYSRGKIRIIPNPANTGMMPALDIELINPALLQLNVYDVTGRLVTAARHDLEAGGHALPVSDKRLDPGIYMVDVETDGRHYVEKMIIQ